MSWTNCAEAHTLKLTFSVRNRVYLDFFAWRGEIINYNSGSRHAKMCLQAYGTAMAQMADQGLHCPLIKSLGSVEQIEV